MTQQEYNFKRQKCWEEYLRKQISEGKSSYSAFLAAFDYAYALGREKEVITQEDIEKLAKEFSERECEIGQVDRDALYKGYYHGMVDSLGKQEKDAEKQKVFTCEKAKVLYHFRMAEACKIGNNPESDYWIGYSKAIQDLFGLEGEPYVTPNNADTVISGWVARDKSGYLVLHYKKPHRTLGNAKWYSAQSQKSLPCYSFPDLTWDDDPIEVELIIKRKKK